MEEKHYLEIACKYGDCASWAIWEEVGSTPKSNMDDMSVFDLSRNPGLLDKLNPHVIMVGLNISKRIVKPFSNFHGANGGAYKIRYAFWDTPFYGAYMTDIVKDFEQKVSGAVIKYLKANKEFEQQNVEVFEQELYDLRAQDPLVIAFGKDSYNILVRNFGGKFKIVMVPHYSNYISQVNYKLKVESILSRL